MRTLLLKTIIGHLLPPDIYWTQLFPYHRLYCLTVSTFLSYLLFLFIQNRFNTLNIVITALPVGIMFYSTRTRTSLTCFYMRLHINILASSTHKYARADQLHFVVARKMLLHLRVSLPYHALFHYWFMLMYSWCCFWCCYCWRQQPLPTRCHNKPSDVAICCCCLANICERKYWLA